MPKCPSCRETVGRNDNYCIECGVKLKEGGGAEYDRDDDASDTLKKLKKDMHRVKEILDDKFGDEDGEEKEDDRDDDRDDRDKRRKRAAKKRKTLFGN